MLAKFLTISTLTLVIVYGSTLGQGIYYQPVIRPLGVEYRVHKTPHFEIIYQRGSEVEAWQTGSTLEGALDEAHSLFDVNNPMWMPVILNNFNDRANGYVHTHPFRQEIEIPHLKGNLIGIGFHSWIEAVATHELVHAVQANADGPIGLGSITRWVAPDNARAFNLSLPSGLNEGVAIYFESRGKRSGRLNDPRFMMLYRAAAASKRPWSLSQLMERPRYGFHLNRYYIGGSAFYSWQYDRDEGQFLRKMRASNYRFPLRFTGIELRKNIGQNLREVKTEFRDDTTPRLRSSLRQSEIILSEPGVTHRWPQWLDQKTLVVYRYALNSPPGLYTVDLDSGQIDLLFSVLLPEDHWFSVADSVIIYSRYVPDRFSTLKMTSDVFTYDLITRKHSRLTKGKRIHMPVSTSSGVWALQNDGQRNQLVTIDLMGNIQILRDRNQADLIQIAPSKDSTAVLVRHNQTQGVYLVEKDGNFTPWIFLDDGFIREISWSSDGRYFLFTADIGGVTNVYSHDQQQHRTIQLTDVMYGALDPILSEDLQTLIYVDYHHENYRVVSEKFSLESGSSITLRPTSEIPEISPQLELPTAFTNTSYSVWRHLRPRMLVPVIDYSSRGSERQLGFGGGFAIHGSDLLRKVTYSVDATIQKNRVWGRAVVRSAIGPIITSLALLNEPDANTVRVFNINGGVEEITYGQQSQAVALTIGLPIHFERNVRHSYARITTGIRSERTRWFSLNQDPVPYDRNSGQSLREFQRSTRLDMGALFVIGLQQNRRDAWPNRGLILGAYTRADLHRQRTSRRSGLYVNLDQYWSFFRKYSSSLRFSASVLTQNSGGVYSNSLILPRGHEEYIGEGTHIRVGAEILQPIWYIEDGFLTIPSYFKLLYIYGFTQRLVQSEDDTGLWSAGIGVGLQFRLFHYLDMEVRTALNPFDIKKSHFSLRQ